MNKSLPALCLLLLITAAAHAQFYFRGEIKDEAGAVLPYVRIHLTRTNSFYYSGAAGSFGIPSSTTSDTAILSLNGFEQKTVVLISHEFNALELKRSGSSVAVQKKRLLSFTKDKSNDPKLQWSASGESYSSIVENKFNNTEVFPVTGFALGVDKASYSNIRRFINMNTIPPPDAVRIEEMLNYFPVPVKEVEPGKTFAYESVITDCPWNEKNKLMIARIHSSKVNYDSAPPANLVLLIDISGSMDLPNRLSLLKTAFRMMVKNLRPVDTISIVTYGGKIAIALYPTGGSEQTKILSVIDSLDAGGDTPGGYALRTAYNLIQPRVLKGGNNRIILATDGDFNVGEVTEDALMQLVSQNQQSGVYLTCLGVGMGNYKDSKLEAIAKKGNGNFAYLDNVMEAEKVLVTECMQTFYVSASDAYLNIWFVPELVKAYRLIGFDNRKDALTDSTIRLEGGEMGSGHTLTAVFEIVPAANLSSLNTPIAEGELTYVPAGATGKMQELIPFYTAYYPFSELDSSYRLHTSVALFGMLLHQSSYVKKEHWNVLLKMLPSSINQQQFLQKEFEQLVLKANALYNPVKKKKGFRRKKETI